MRSIPSLHRVVEHEAKECVCRGSSNGALPHCCRIAARWRKVTGVLLLLAVVALINISMASERTNALCEIISLRLIADDLKEQHEQRKEWEFSLNLWHAGWSVALQLFNTWHIQISTVKIYCMRRI